MSALTRPHRYSVPVTAKTWLTGDVASLWVRVPELAKPASPGQFLGLKAGPDADPLLRRPVSIADVLGDNLRLVFRVVGRGTELLSRLKPGDVLDVLGPLGRPAPLSRKLSAAGRRLVLCGGGVGAAPLLFLARRLRMGPSLRVVLGARTKSQLILVKEFRSLGARVSVATDDGSAGYRGMVTDLVEKEFRTPNTGRRAQNKGRPSAVSRQPSAIAACGPRPMLRRLVQIADPIPVWGFVEERMGCGTGVCYCCALPRKNGGYVRFCQEGPVVLLNEVEL